MVNRISDEDADLEFQNDTSKMLMDTNGKHGGYIDATLGQEQAQEL